VAMCCIRRKDLQSLKLFLRLFCELYYIRKCCDSIGRTRISRSIPCGGKNFLFSQLSSAALRHTHTISYSMGAGAFPPKAKRPRSAALSYLHLVLRSITSGDILPLHKDIIGRSASGRGNKSTSA